MKLFSNSRMSEADALEHAKKLEQKSGKESAIEFLEDRISKTPDELEFSLFGSRQLLAEMYIEEKLYDEAYHHASILEQQFYGEYLFDLAYEHALRLLCQTTKLMDHKAPRKRWDSRLNLLQLIKSEDPKLQKLDFPGWDYDVQWKANTLLHAGICKIGLEEDNENYGVSLCSLSIAISEKSGLLESYIKHLFDTYKNVVELLIEELIEESDPEIADIYIRKYEQVSKIFESRS